eukprot:TRINITY_DN3691_c0_g1_i2.p2 TRINITY_DN3691_c0_g1~~TRINITY_DN3691_c0_g1_i2.p2  ORF type:complete len:108 (+),score=20.83 TRINITY_DN3691_c0_g1_i2:84-407(+)
MKEANYISPASFNKSKKRCRSFVPPKKMQLKDLCTLLNLAASTYSKPTHFQASLQGKAIPKYQAHSKPNQPNLFATCQETTPHHLSLIHICRCRRYAVCRSRWSPYH